MRLPSLLRPIVMLLGLVALSAPSAHPAQAAVPDPSQSTVPTCFLACPAGDVEFKVIVRDVLSLPVPNALVELNLCQCTTLNFCPGPQGGPVCSQVAISDASGTAVFNVRVGGICPSGLAQVRADGVLLSATVQVRTFDLDGSLVVDGPDQAIATGLLGMPGGIADFNCSGLVQPDDVANLNKHLGDNCNGPVPAHAASWGQVKTIYR